MPDKKIEKQNAPGIASEEENASLEHSEGGETTRADALDLGAKMLPGDPSEPAGPEDALGPGPKRGDYRNLIGDSSYQPHTTEIIPDAKPGEPQYRLVPQKPRAENIGDVPGRKGGVTTNEDEAS